MVNPSPETTTQATRTREISRRKCVYVLDDFDKRLRNENCTSTYTWLANHDNSECQ